MKIKVFSGKVKIFLWIPLWLPLVRLGLKIGHRYSDRVPPDEVLLPVVKEVKRFRRQNGRFTLVEVCAADGSIVKITL